MGMVIPLAWLLAGLTVPLSGVVVDGEGRPVAGASVWLGDTIATNDGPEVLASGETDANGRFRLERAETLAGRGSYWSPTLWAYQPGSRLASIEFKRKVPGPDEPVTLTLRRGASTTLRVLGADGKPANGARVLPVPISTKAPRPPDKLLERLAARVDPEGRVTLDAYAPADLIGVDVAVEGQVVQCLPIGPDDGTVTIRATGRLAVRVVADDPAAAKGWKVTATIRPDEAGYKGPYTTQWARETTGDDGRASFPPLAVGQVFLGLEPPAGSDYLQADRQDPTLRPGAPLDVALPVRRGVRVEGSVLEEPGGTPIPGIKVDLFPLRTNSGRSRDLVADAQGRFSKALLPGTVRFSFSYHEMLPTYFLAPGIQTWLDFEVRDGQERQSFTPPRLRKAAQVRGRVIDRAGSPVAGARVSASWNSSAFGREPNTRQVEADARGEFIAGSIAPGAEVRIWASLGYEADSEPTILTAGEAGPPGDPITLRLIPRATLALSGRVVGDDGRPLEGIPIRIMIRTPGQPISPGSEYTFEGSESVRTGPDGRYRTPDRLPVGNDYSVAVNQPDFEPSATRWIVAAPFEVPDLPLKRRVGNRGRSGRVVDSEGRPIAGVEVFQSGDGPKRTRGLSDADGRFLVPGIPNAPALLFASKPGYRFLGRRVDPGLAPVEFALRRLDEPPASRLQAIGPAVPREEERAMARSLLAEARKAPGGDWDHPERSEIPAIAALLDPDGTLQRIEDQIISVDARLLGAIALRRSEDRPARVLDLLDAIEGPELIATTAFDLHDRLGATVPPEVHRGLIERAERAARRVADPGQAASLLAKVADLWFDLGDPNRAETLARQAQTLAAKPREQPYPDPADDLALALARIDLPGALKLLEGREAQQSWQIDRIRSGIALRVAPTNPAEAKRLIGLIQDDRARHVARRNLASRLARSDLPAARAIVADDPEPMADALLPAIAAQAREHSDPDSARALLAEAVERLGRIEFAEYEQSSSRPSPALALARLLPLASRLDPDGAPGTFWLALSRRSPVSAVPEPKPIFPWHRRHYLDLAELAVLAGRYDRAAAEVVFAPVAARLVGLHDEFWGLGGEGPPLYKAAGAFDARIARTLLEALPADPVITANSPVTGNVPRQRSKAEARIGLAQILAWPPALRLRSHPFPPSGNEWLDLLDD